jgi:branched-chain amino acid transport system permease protein
MYFFGQLVSGLAIGSIYSLLGLGFTMIFACTRRINFAHGDLMALGGFLGLFFLGVFPSVPVAAYIVAPLMNGFITAGVERVFFRRLQEAQPLKIVIATIGLSIILKIIMKMIWGTDPIAYPPLISEKTFSFFGVGIVPQTVVILLVALSLMILLQVFFLYTKSGRGLRAFSQDRYAGQLMGVRIGWSISLTVDLTDLFHLEYDGNPFGSEVLCRSGHRRTGERSRDHCRRALSWSGRKLFFGIYLFQL